LLSIFFLLNAIRCGVLSIGGSIIGESGEYREKNKCGAEQKSNDELRAGDDLLDFLFDDVPEHL